MNLRILFLVLVGCLAADGGAQAEDAVRRIDLPPLDQHKCDLLTNNLTHHMDATFNRNPSGSIKSGQMAAYGSPLDSNPGAIVPSVGDPLLLVGKSCHIEFALRERNVDKINADPHKVLASLFDPSEKLTQLNSGHEASCIESGDFETLAGQKWICNIDRVTTCHESKGDVCKDVPCDLWQSNYTVDCVPVLPEFLRTTPAPTKPHG